MEAIAVPEDDLLPDHPSPLSLTPTLRGSLAETSLAEVFERILEEGLTGTLTLLPDGSSLEDSRVVLSEGIPIAAQLPYACDDLFEGLLALLAEQGTYLFHEGEDLTDPELVVTGIVDPAHLLALASPLYPAEVDLPIEIEHDSQDFIAALLAHASGVPGPPAPRGRDLPMTVEVAPSVPATFDLFVIDPYEETREEIPAPRELDGARPEPLVTPPAPEPEPARSPALVVPDLVALEREASEVMRRADVARAKGADRLPAPPDDEEPFELAPAISPAAGPSVEIEVDAEAPLELEMVPGVPACERQLEAHVAAPKKGAAEAARLGYQDARRLAASGRLDQAICRLVAVARLDPDEATYQVALAATLMRRYPGPDAPQERIAAALDRALRLDPGCAEAHHLKGLTMLARDRRRAVNHLKRAVELDPSHAEARRTLARAERATSPIKRLLRGIGGRS